MKTISMFIKSVKTTLIPMVLLCFGLTFVSGQPVTNPNTLLLNISGNGYSDQTYVVIVPGSTFGFDSQYDAYKLMGIYAAPQLYSIINCCNLSVNAIPEIYNGMEVQLGCRFGAETTYTIEAYGLQTFGNDTTIVLEDTETGTITSLMTDSVYSFTGYTTDPTTRFKLHFYCPMRFDIKLFLGGAWLSSGTMTNRFDIDDLLPNDQPYSGSPWNYAGTEHVALFPYNNVTDWVLVELRDAADAASANGTTVVEQQACLLLQDGSIVSTDNESLPLFTSVFTQQPFVVVYHRNHLPVLSAGPLTRNGGVYSWDFTTGAGQAYGTDALFEPEPGFFATRPGDANADGLIDNDDKISFWQLIAGKAGYLSSDFNLDSEVNNLDKNGCWLPHLGFSSQLP
ncbi:MAG: hypothetical protein Kow00127_23510 [Bacteroidales bacterium]